MSPWFPCRGHLLCRDQESERGSEVVSYVLVQFLVITVFLMLMQCALFVYARNTAISAASEGARRYALLGGTSLEAQADVRDVMLPLLGEGRVNEVAISRRRSGHYEVAVVTFRTTLPIFFTMGPDWLEVSGSAVMEDSLR